MIIKSINGKTLFQSDIKTMRSALEYCALHGIELPYADLRRAKLSCAGLDGLIAPHARFWGADLCGADMGLADLRGCDFRTVDLKDACLAESNLSRADFRGAYFSGTILEGAVLDFAQVSCPSFWSCDLRSVRSFGNMTFVHRGEARIVIDQPPIVVGGLSLPVVLNGATCLWGSKLYPAGLLPRALQKELFSLKTAIEKMMVGDESRNAMNPIPKIQAGKG